MSRGRQGPKFLTPSEAAGRLGCTPRTLATWSAREKGLRASVVFTVGGHRRYLASLIDAHARKAAR